MSVRRLLPLVLLFLATSAMVAAAPLRIGVVTDIHAHDTNSPTEHKVMTNFEARLAAFTDAMTAWPADAVLELGDLVNGAFVMGAPLGDPARIAGILTNVLASLDRFPGPTHFVLGNHDVYDLSKAEFLAATGAQATAWSLDLGGFHFVALDAQFSKAGQDYGHSFWVVPGTVPPAQLAWLKSDLASTALPTIVLVHQPLDVEFEAEAGGPSVSNRLEVQAALRDSGRVVAVFQGHSHENRHTITDGIHYVTFAAMVDSDVPTEPSWAAVMLDSEARTVTVDGFGLQQDLEFGY